MAALHLKAEAHTHRLARAVVAVAFDRGVAAALAQDDRGRRVVLGVALVGERAAVVVVFEAARRRERRGRALGELARAVVGARVGGRVDEAIEHIRCRVLDQFLARLDYSSSISNTDIAADAHSKWNIKV